MNNKENQQLRNEFALRSEIPWDAATNYAYQLWAEGPYHKITTIQILEARAQLQFIAADFMMAEACISARGETR